ncbi:MAG: hypothetical protein NTY35_08175 [Planctomycetota bacterium]|nr:hypothetical protein [Planctomycetota bacterium]
MNARISIAIAALSLLAGCKSQEPVSGSVQDVVEVCATVTAVDLPHRLLTLKGQEGVEVVVEAGPAVQNLGQVHVGDTVAVSYTAAVSWRVRSPGEGGPGITTRAGVEKAKPGEKPAASVGGSVTLTATITAIDPAEGTVALTGPAGNTVVLQPRDPANLHKVKVGELVDITYSEALAASVRPVAKPK